MEQKLRELSREKLLEIIMRMAVHLSDVQRQKLEKIIEESAAETAEFDELESGKKPAASRMSQEFVDEKLAQLKGWMEQIDEGELCLQTSGGKI